MSNSKVVRQLKLLCCSELRKRPGLQRGKGGKAVHSKKRHTCANHVCPAVRVRLSDKVYLVMALFLAQAPCLNSRQLREW